MDGGRRLGNFRTVKLAKEAIFEARAAKAEHVPLLIGRAAA
jgi:hypothetical protein